MDGAQRRAVFQWRGAAEPGGATHYAIQKIARNGATANPAPQAFLALPRIE